MDKLQRIIFGATDGTEESPSPQTMTEGVIQSVGADGIMFTIPAWDDGLYIFGPAPWPQVGAPVSGDRCLVVFVDDSPWVIGWWPA